MVGDLTDIVGRIRALLPTRWFADNAPNLTALLAGLAIPAVWLYDRVAYVRTQSRLATLTGFWLDLSALDFFGSKIVRRPGEPDTPYRQRIMMALFQEAVTRSAIISALTEMTGTEPIVFEPARPSDTGVYASASIATSTELATLSYNQVGGWGSLQLPYQFFVSSRRPAAPLVANLSGYGCPFGGYGEGQLSYVDLAALPGGIRDTDIQSQVSGLLPVNTTAWLCII